MIPEPSVNPPADLSRHVGIDTEHSQESAEKTTPLTQRRTEKLPQNLAQKPAQNRTLSQAPFNLPHPSQKQPERQYT